MIIVFAILAGVLIVLQLLSPKAEKVHAAKTTQLIERFKKLPFVAIYRDAKGRRISLRGKMLALVEGESCAADGIRDGDLVIASKLNEGGRAILQAGDLVIINSELPADKIVDVVRPKRFRKIESIADGEAIFFKVEQIGRPDFLPRKQKLSDVYAKVEYVSG